MVFINIEHRTLNSFFHILRAYVLQVHALTGFSLFAIQVVHFVSGIEPLIFISKINNLVK